nr:ELKS/Rab6-interacting/CAST family member 1-like [Lepeophtheirus salmonis]
MEISKKLSNKVKEKNIRISPSVYLRLLRHVVHIHSEKSGELEQRKSRLQIGIEKFNQVEEQLKEFELELESIREKIQNVKKEKEEMKSTKFNLDELLESVKTRYEEVSSQLDEYIQQKGEKEHIYKDKLARIEDKYSGLRNSMGNLKISEIQALKNVKFNLPLLKLCLQCMNLYSINDGEKGLETDPKKEVEPYVEEVNRLSVLIDEKELLKDETYEKIQTTQDKINDVEGKIKKIQSSYEQLMIELDRCLEKKSLGNLVYENFKGVIEFWSNILSKIKEDLITLLGDVAFYSMDIVLCSPFTLDQRDRLRRSFEEKAIKLEILFSQNYLQQLLEPNTTLCWSHFIHARDEFSLSKLCTIKSNLHWSYIFNLNDEGYQILLSAEKDKKIEYIRYGSKGYLNKLENAVVGGFLTIIEDVSSYDYRLKNILTKNLITKKNDSGKGLYD